MTPTTTSESLSAAVTPGEWTPRASDTDWPPEVELLILCARVRLEERDARRIREILHGEVDWNHLFRLTSLHRMRAFLFRHLGSAAPDLVPGPNLDFLRSRFLHDGAEALRDMAQLLELLETFERNGVLAVPYKGPALAISLYENVAFRRCNDIDILVTRDDVQRSREILEAIGFVPLHPTSPAGREYLLQKRHSEIFIRDRGHIVELHWAFAKQRGVFPLDLEMLRPRLRETSISGSRVWEFSPEDQLLILASHGAEHVWSRLEWLCGLAELIRRVPLDWTVALARAYELHSEKTLLLGLTLAHEVLDAPVPAELMAQARASGDVVRSADLVKRKLASGIIPIPEQRGTLERDWFRLRLQSTNGARIRYILHRITTPGREDTKHMVPVGKHFVPLPAFLRPFHLFGKLLGRKGS